MNNTIRHTPNDLPERVARLDSKLQAAGVLTDPAWLEALHAVPRHRFIPACAWLYRGEVVELDRDREPEPWWDAVYDRDAAIITQFNDGAGPPDRPGVLEPSSSCTAPAIQLQMLQALAVKEGMRVLEIGTGTGWGAALLAHRLGDEHVVTIEVDGVVLQQALKALASSGQSPLAVASDGSHGYRPGAPYDRILATCAVHTIPTAWVRQTRPGGLIVTPWTPLASPGGNLLARLQVGGDGTASGPFIGTVGFMWLREQRRARELPRPPVRAEAPAGTVTSTTAVDPVALLFRTKITAFLAQLGLGDGRYGITRREGVDETIVWLSDPTATSWARVFSPVPFEDTPPDRTRFVVEQFGLRRLWDEIQAIHDWWADAGQPSHLRFGLTAGPDGQAVWLDDPSQPVFLLRAPAAPTFVGANG